MTYPPAKPRGISSGIRWCKVRDTMDYTACIQMMLSFFRQLDWVNLITGALVPLLIMYLTLRSEKKRHSEALKQQSQEHQAEMIEQKNASRLSIMPVFDVVGISGKFYSLPLKTMDKIDHLIEIRLKNVGNGAAVSPMENWVPSEDSLKQVYESETAYYKRWKDISNDALIVGMGKEISIILNREKKTDNPVPVDWVVLPIQFKDLLENEYKQRIAIQIGYSSKDASVELLELKTNIPEIQKKVSD